MAGENGTNLFLKLNGEILGAETSSTFSSNRDEIELSSKEDGQSSTYQLTRRHNEISFEGKFKVTGNNDWNDLWEFHTSDTATPFIWGGGDSGDFVLTGNCLIRDLEFTSPDAENVTFSGVARVTGDVTKGTYS